MDSAPRPVTPRYSPTVPPGTSTSSPFRISPGRSRLGPPVKRSRVACAASCACFSSCAWRRWSRTSSPTVIPLMFAASSSPLMATSAVFWPWGKPERQSSEGIGTPASGAWAAGGAVWRWALGCLPVSYSWPFSSTNSPRPTASASA